eukprot:753652-Hanusia_phi.AAC.2
MSIPNTVEMFRDRVGCHEQMVCCGTMLLESCRPHRILEVDNEVVSMFDLQKNACIGKTVDSITGEKTHSTWTFLHGIKLATDQIGSAVSLTISCAKRKKVCKKLFIVVQQHNSGGNLTVGIVVPTPAFSHFLEPVVKCTTAVCNQECHQVERSEQPAKRKLEDRELDRRMERRIIPSEITFTHCAPKAKKFKPCSWEAPAPPVTVTTSDCYFDQEIVGKRKTYFGNLESSVLPPATFQEVQSQGSAEVFPSLIQSDNLDLCYEAPEFDSVSTDASSLDFFPSLCGYSVSVNSSSFNASWACLPSVYKQIMIPSWGECKEGVVQRGFFSNSSKSCMLQPVGMSSQPPH